MNRPGNRELMNPGRHGIVRAWGQSTPIHRSHPMIPKKFAPMLFGLILSGLMSLLVSGISTLRATGLVAGFAGMWASAWLTAWAIAFPTVLVIAPLTRRLVDRLTTNH